MKRKSLVATTVTKRHHRDEIWLSWPAAAQGGDSSKPAGATPARTSGHSLSKPICLQHSDARGRRRTPRSLPRRLPAQELRHGSGRSHACVLDISAKWRRATHDRRRYGAMEPGTGVWRGLCQALTSARATDRTPLRESGVRLDGIVGNSCCGARAAYVSGHPVGPGHHLAVAHGRRTD